MEISAYQQRFWLEWKLEPQSFQYNTPLIYHIKGDLNIPALNKALSCYVNDFHKSNRYYFVETEQNQVEQRCLDKIEINLEFEDISHLSDAEVSNYINKICQHIFDLSKPPLFRFGLLKFAEMEYLLVLNFHHIITDAFTAVFLVENVSKLYQHFAFAEAHPKPELEEGPDFLDYLSTHKKNYPEDTYIKDLKYWTSLLKNRPLEVPFDFKEIGKEAREAGNDLISKNKASSSYYFSLDSDITLELKNLAKHHRSTPFILLSALFSFLLYRYTEEKEIVLSYPVNTRPPGYQGVPGCFVNNVAMMVDYNDRTLSVADLIMNCTEQRKDSKQHAYCSLTDIIQELKKESASIGDNYFNVSIVEANLNLRPLDFGNLEVSSIPYTPHVSFNDLSLYYQISKNEIGENEISDKETVTFRLDYRLNVFEPFLIEQFARHFKHLIRICIKDPSKKLSDISLLQEQDLTLIASWNSNYRYQSFPEQKTLYQLFQEQVLKTPTAIALSMDHGTTKLSFEALDARVNFFAAETAVNAKNSGNTKLDNIALCLEKGLELVIGILATLKLGAAYIPIDLKDTNNRNRSIFEDANVDLILSDAQTITQCPWLLSFSKERQKPIVLINPNSTQHKDFIYEYPAYSGQDLAYVLYTSGTTGKPKGVMIEHHSVVNIVLDIKKRLNITEKDRILSVTAATFDIYGLELYLALLSGACHIICPSSIVRDPAKLIAFIRKNKPTLIQATPSLFAMILPYMKKGDYIPHILCGGEKLSKTLAESLMKISDNVWNVYGPTETTIWSSFFKLQEGQTPYIGRAFANTDLQVLDADQNPVPIGVTGELYIGGVGLARGYLNDNEKTAQKFIQFKASDAIKFGASSEVRMYRTGDRVRWAEQGFLEYRGRHDHDSQQKILGHRIELSEIETQMMRHSTIEQAVVKILKLSDLSNLTETPKIVAFYTQKRQNRIEKIFKLLNIFNSNPIVTPAMLSTFLEQVLPHYMLPVAFVKLDEIPLTPHGKTDYSKLPKPSSEHFPISKSSYKSFDSIELRLKNLWCQILTLDELSQKDDFFKIGGNSILAVHLISHINRQFKLDLPVAWVLQNNTIASQTKSLRNDPNTLSYCPIISFDKINKIHPKLYYDHLQSETVSENTIVNTKINENVNADDADKNVSTNANRSANTNLFLLHPGLTGAEVYADFAKNFGPEIKVFALDSYNLNSGKAFMKSIEELSAYYLTQIRILQPSGPYFLAGWSLGGMIAYEMAQQLHRASETVAGLYLLDTHIYTQDFLNAISASISLENLLQEVPEDHGEYIRSLPDRRLDRVLSSLQNDVNLLINYKIKPYTGNLFLFKTTSETSLNVGLTETEYNGWKNYVRDIERVLINCSHFGLMEKPHDLEISRHIERQMKEIKLC